MNLRKKGGETPKKSVKKSVRTASVARTSHRCPRIETISLGKIPSKYVSGVSFATDDEVDEFIKNIKYGPQVCSIPVPPWRHAFLVNIKEDKIMISDWIGKEAQLRGIEQIPGKRTVNTYYKKGWEQYYDILQRLKEEYHKPIEFYEIDDEIKKISVQNNKDNGGGGCSDYIYRWVIKHASELYTF